MKNLLLTLGVFSLFFFSSCGGGHDHDHDCCGKCGDEKAECCGKCGGDKDGEKKSECCGEGGECCKSGDSK
jgi:hypothetical protein